VGGLVVLGSYVPKSSKQLAALLAQAKVTPIELNVADVIRAARQSGSGNKETMEAIVTVKTVEVQTALLAGENVVLYTTRGFLEGEATSCELVEYIA
jgi:uncharacterized protein YgbK (DUF1537 family)